MEIVNSELGELKLDIERLQQELTIIKTKLEGLNAWKELNHEDYEFF